MAKEEIIRLRCEAKRRESGDRGIIMTSVSIAGYGIFPHFR